MKHYYWHGIDAKGIEHSGSMLADSPDNLKRKLFKKGIALLHVKPFRTETFKEFFRRFESSDKQLIFFFSTLSLLLKSGLSVLEALGVVKEHMRSRAWLGVVRSVAKSVEHGELFSSALQKHAHYFKPLTIHTVKAGERAGGLAVVLDVIAQDLKLKTERQKKMKRAMMLPVLTLLFALVIVLGVFVVVIPQFEMFFSSMDKKLPEATERVLRMSNWIRSGRGVVWFLVSTLLCIGAARFCSARKAFREYADYAVLKIAYLKNLMLLNQFGRLSATVAMLIRSGVTLHESLVVARETLTNSYVRQELASVITLVRQGNSFSDSLKTLPAFIMPHELVSFVEVGQRSGSMPEMLEKVGMLYFERLDSHLKVITSLLQPFLMIAVGLLVAFLMISVYLPIFNMVSIL